MSTVQESIVIESRPGDGTGVGVINASIDVLGVKAFAPTRHMQDANILHDKIELTQEMIATTVSNHMWTAREGRWQVAGVMYMPRVSGSGGAATVQVEVSSGVVAPSAGTTQLTAGLDVVGTADTLQRGVLIAAPTVIGPGDSVGFVVTGTWTSVVGRLTVDLIRIS